MKRGVVFWEGRALSGSACPFGAEFEPHLSRNTGVQRDGAADPKLFGRKSNPVTLFCTFLPEFEPGVKPSLLNALGKHSVHSNPPLM